MFVYDKIMTIWIQFRIIKKKMNLIYVLRGHHGRDHLVVGFTTTYALSAYHY
jgi:hypothetical protein